MEYYKIVFYNTKTKEQEIGIVKAESHFDAEKKGEKYVENWNSLELVLQFNYADWLNKKQIENGEVVLVT